MKDYIETFCGVCQRHFAIRMQPEWPKEAFIKTREKLAWITLHENHENAKVMPLNNKLMSSW